MSYVGDFALGATLDIKFTSRRFSTGAPYTLAGTPSVAAYPDNSTTEITAGITLTTDFDSRTGLNNVRVVATSGNGYATATNYTLVLTAGTVDSVSVVGEVVGEFSIEARSALRPTTAGRTLDVSSTGEAGVDWGNVGSPTTTVTLSGTTVKTATDVETDTADIQSRIPAALVSGRIDASVGAMAAGTVTAAAIATDAIDADAIAADAVAEIQSGLATAASIAALNNLSAAQVNAEVDTALADIHLDHLIAVADPGSVVADSSFLAKLTSKSATPSFASYSNQTDSLEAIRDRGDAAWTTATGFSTLDAAGVRSAVGMASANLDTQLTGINTNIDAVDTSVAGVAADIAALNDLSATDVENAVWDATLASHLTAGSTGNALNAAGSAGDPWATALPGAYGAGTAGKIVGDNLDAAVSSRLATAGYTAPDNATISTVNTKLGTPASSVSADIAAVQADTDNIQTRLPAALVSGRIDASVGAMATDTLTSGALAASAVTEIQSGLATAAAISALNNLSAAQVNAEVDTALADVGMTLTVTGRIDAAISTRASQTSVDDLPTNAELATALAAADDAVLAAIAALNNLSAAQVNAEVVDALSTDTYAEPGQGTPLATTTLAAKIGYLYKAWRNKTEQTSALYSLYGDDGTTVDQKAAVSDDSTTFTRGEVVTGA